ncbi:MAG: photosystem I reaction center subunit IV, partial [Xanthomonadales bacterium]|nr:photosystem I reaction center subunit IV [Xanthomonadales bacterium]
MRDSLKIRAIGWLSAMLVATLAGPTHAVDLLELPAIQSEAASRSLLLDATARGEGALVAVGSFGVIIKSEDSGATWTQASVPASVTLTAVDFPTPEKGWAVGHDGLIIHSDDGGKTWRKQLDGHQLNEQVVAVAERIVEQVRQEFEALQAEEEPDEYALEDAEFMLEEAEFALEGAMDDTAAGPVRPLLDVWFRNEREGFVLGSYGMLIVTED